MNLQERGIRFSRLTQRKKTRLCSVNLYESSECLTLEKLVICAREIAIFILSLRGESASPRSARGRNWKGTRRRETQGEARDSVSSRFAPFAARKRAAEENREERKKGQRSESRVDKIDRNSHTRTGETDRSRLRTIVWRRDAPRNRRQEPVWP